MMRLRWYPLLLSITILAGVTMMADSRLHSPSLRKSSTSSSSTSSSTSASESGGTATGSRRNQKEQQENGKERKMIKKSRPNILWIMTDQQRFDAIRRVQDDEGMPHVYNMYNNLKNGGDGSRTTTKLRTPNLDKLSKDGAYFRNAYCQSPVCGPARTSLRTGCTIERTGVQENGLINDYRNTRVFEERVLALEGLDHILSNEGYDIEYYGKWHLPDTLYQNRTDRTRNIIRFNHYDYKTKEFLFSDQTIGSKFKSFLEYHSKDVGSIPTQDALVYTDGEQQDTYSKYPYIPNMIDARYGHPTNTDLRNGQFSVRDKGQSSVSGNYSLSENYTTSHFIADTSIKALYRLLVTQKQYQEGGKNIDIDDINDVDGISDVDNVDADDDDEYKPFFLTVSFNSPHPPTVPAWKHLKYYMENKDTIPIPPSLEDKLENSGYKSTSIDQPRYGNVTAVQEWTAAYYALVEEVDEYVGKILSTLRETGGNDMYDDTLIIFTSDHGEMLGAHGCREKNKFYEESVHVPLFISYPNRINPDTIVDEPVSHIDVVATILDYIGLSSASSSASSTSAADIMSEGTKNRYDHMIDGKSLRPFIERTSYNEHYDENIVVAEWDFRLPVEEGEDHRQHHIPSTTELTRGLDQEMAFMIRKDQYKLMIRKKQHPTHDSRLDMMFDLSTDPYEMNNLLGYNSPTASEPTLQKAEHLRCLLLSWMERMDHPHGGIDGNDSPIQKGGYYSDPEANYGEGQGDMIEVQNRQTWPALDFWISDTKIQIGHVVWDPTNRCYIRREYLFLGSRRGNDNNKDVDDNDTSSSIKVSSIEIGGIDGHKIEIDKTELILQPNECNFIQITYRSYTDEESSLFAYETPLDVYLLLKVERRRQQVTTSTSNKEEKEEVKILIGLASEIDDNY